MVTNSNLPEHYNDIDKIYVEIWERLIDGKKNRNSELHQCYVATNSDKFPALRTVVLRHVNQENLSIGFHTDKRSNKINEISEDSNVSVLFYDHEHKIQIRINGQAEVNHNNDSTAAIWSNIRSFSKKCYLVEKAPGTQSEIPTSGYPPQFESILPSDAELEAGYENFTYINIQIESIEWLYLHKDGHRRALFNFTDNNINKQWITP
jgi:hypothetical protein